MDNSKKYMETNGYDDRISFNDLKAHTVKLLKDKEDSIPGPQGPIKGMKYLVEEDGKQKEIFTGSIGLISKLALCETGETVTIKMGKANNKSFYTVLKDGVDVKNPDTSDLDEEEVPPPSPEW